MNDRDEIVERLTAHRAIGDSPRAELEWLANHGTLRHLDAGDVIARPGEVPGFMMVMLAGHGAVYVDRGSGRRKAFEWGTGDVTGLLPFSRLRQSVGEAVMDEATDALLLFPEDFPGLIRECPTITGHLVHAMIDRVRHFSSTDWQDDKLVSLGRLAAGLAHELNNPASAAARSARTLGDLLDRLTAAASDLARARLSDSEYETIEALLASALHDSAGKRSALERADREDEISDWLSSKHLDTGTAATLAESEITQAQLETLSGSLAPSKLDIALRWISSAHAARAVANEVQRAAQRIHDLVSSVKRFTYMDRAVAPEPTDVRQALMDTIAVLGGKARDKRVAVRLEVSPNLPKVNGFGAELNQVWSNLLENALDAANSPGEVAVRAVCENGWVVVRVIDNGHGIAPEHLSRVFDPFFTTKPLGQGTGLGLDIARRIVRLHDGQIEAESRPGRTEFRVTLPASRPVAP